MKNRLPSAFPLWIAMALFTTALIATPSRGDEPPKPDPEAFKAKLVKMAGALGPFANAEDFPKSYFLISQNLPFMVGLALHHPMSNTLKLTDEQKAKIKKIEESTVPVVVKSAKKIKEKEVALAQKLIDGASVEEMEKMVDEISALRTILTKKHLVCTDKVRTILTPEQFEAMQGYANQQSK